MGETCKMAKKEKSQNQLYVVVLGNYSSLQQHYELLENTKGKEKTLVLRPEDPKMNYMLLYSEIIIAITL